MKKPRSLRVNWSTQLVSISVPVKVTDPHQGHLVWGREWPNLLSMLSRLVICSLRLRAYGVTREVSQD